MEVSAVTAGYRVTLTYNLHLVKPDSSIAKEPAPSALYEASLTEICEQLKVALLALLSSPTFLPNGGFLGFGLMYKYPFTTGTDLSAIEHYLKGADVAFAQVCGDLSLSFELKAIYTDDESPNTWALVDEFPNLEGCSTIDEEGGESILAYLDQSGYNVQSVRFILSTIL